MMETLQWDGLSLNSLTYRAEIGLSPDFFNILQLSNIKLTVIILFYCS